MVTNVVEMADIEANVEIVPNSSSGSIFCCDVGLAVASLNHAYSIVALNEMAKKLVTENLNTNTRLALDNAVDMETSKGATISAFVSQLQCHGRSVDAELRPLIGAMVFVLPHNSVRGMIVGFENVWTAWVRMGSCRSRPIAVGELVAATPRYEDEEVVFLRKSMDSCSLSRGRMEKAVDMHARVQVFVPGDQDHDIDLGESVTADFHFVCRLFPRDSLNPAIRTTREKESTRLPATTQEQIKQHESNGPPSQPIQGTLDQEIAQVSTRLQTIMRHSPQPRDEGQATASLSPELVADVSPLQLCPNQPVLSQPSGDGIVPSCCMQCWGVLTNDGTEPTPEPCPHHRGPPRYAGLCGLPNKPLERVCFRNSSVQALLCVEPIIRACAHPPAPNAALGPSEKRVRALKHFFCMAVHGLSNADCTAQIEALGGIVMGELGQADVGPGSMSLSRLHRPPHQDIDAQEFLSRLLNVLVGDDMSISLFGSQWSSPRRCSKCGRYVALFVSNSLYSFVAINLTLVHPMMQHQSTLSRGPSRDFSSRSSPV